MSRNTLHVFSLSLILSVACAAAGTAEAPTVALSDFAVNSGNPSYAFLGKGFAEIVAFELRKSPALKLVDREKRNQLLEEMEFSLTGLTDPGAQLEMGKLLSVRYLVSGSITDMGGPLLVSLSMVDVESGQIVWNDQVTEKGGRYAYIGAYFGKSLLKHFKASVSKSTEVELASKVEKDAASVVALSQGIAALDKGNKAEAKAKLAEAKKIDPGNAVAGAFLDKLASASAKFKVVPERYVPYYNPAYLGGMEKDRAYINNVITWIQYGVSDPHNSGLDVANPAGTYGARETQMFNSIGYALPLGGGIGLGVDAILNSDTDMIVDIQPGHGFPVLGNEMPSFSGGMLTLGFVVNPNLSLGLGLDAAYKNRRYYLMSWPTNEYRSDPYLTFGGVAAVALKNEGGSVAWDGELAYSKEQLFWYDPVADTFNPYNAPIYFEQTLTFALGGKKTFIALKQANDIYVDRSMYFGRAMPCLEQWFGEAFAVRAGAEGTLFARDGSMVLGWGATGGLTLRLFGFDLDANYTFRLRPSRTLADTLIPESVLFFTLTKNGIFRR
jgi:TolB-like protein